MKDQGYILCVSTFEPRKRIDRLIEHAFEDGSVRRLGFVSEDALQALYAGAKPFICPSRYEGFGLPVVEANESSRQNVISEPTDHLLLKEFIPAL